MPNAMTKQAAQRSRPSACCVLLVLAEYELAYWLVDSLRTCQPFQALMKL
jgi:hypothetical protein